MHEFGFHSDCALDFQRDHEKMKITREREEKLIVSAWYEMVSFSAFTRILLAKKKSSKMLSGVQ